MKLRLPLLIVSQVRISINIKRTKYNTMNWLLYYPHSNHRDTVTKWLLEKYNKNVSHYRCGLYQL